MPSTPQTPRTPRVGESTTKKNDVPATPSRQQVEASTKWLKQIDTESGDAHHSTLIDNILDHLNGLGDDERTSMKIEIVRKLMTVHDRNPNPLDALIIPDILERAKLTLAQKSKSQKAKGGNQRSSDSGEEEDGSDEMDLGDESATDKRSRRRSKRGAARDEVEVVGASRPASEKEQLIEAYRSIGWVNGNGSSREVAKIFGTLRKPRQTKTTMAVSAARNSKTTSELRKDFEDWLRDDFRWEARDKNKHCWARLHPWAISLFSEIFFTHLVGFKFFANVNNIIKALTTVDQDGMSRWQGKKAFNFIKSNPDTPNCVQNVFMGVAKRVDLSSNRDAYNEYLKVSYDVATITGYQTFVDKLLLNTRNPERLFLQKHRGNRPIGRSLKQCQSAAKRFFEESVDMNNKQFDNIINRAQPATHFHNAYGESVLLLLGKSEWASLGKIGVGSIPGAIAKFNELVPEFKSTMREFERKVLASMNDETQYGIKQLTDVHVRTERGRIDATTNNWQDRVHEILGDINTGSTVTEELSDEIDETETDSDEDDSSTSESSDEDDDESGSDSDSTESGDSDTDMDD